MAECPDSSSSHRAIATSPNTTWTTPFHVDNGVDIADGQIADTIDPPPEENTVESPGADSGVGLEEEATVEQKAVLEKLSTLVWSLSSLMGDNKTDRKKKDALAAKILEQCRSLAPQAPPSVLEAIAEHFVSESGEIEHTVSMEGVECVAKTCLREYWPECAEEISRVQAENQGLMKELAAVPPSRLPPVSNDLSWFHTQHRKVTALPGSKAPKPNFVAPDMNNRHERAQAMHNLVEVLMGPMGLSQGKTVRASVMTEFQQFSDYDQHALYALTKVLSNTMSEIMQRKYYPKLSCDGRENKSTIAKGDLIYAVSSWNVVTAGTDVTDLDFVVTVLNGQLVKLWPCYVAEKEDTYCMVHWIVSWDGGNFFKAVPRGEWDDTHPVRQFEGADDTMPLDAMLIKGFNVKPGSRMEKAQTKIVHISPIVECSGTVPDFSKALMSQLHDLHHQKHLENSRRQQNIAPQLEKVKAMMEARNQRNQALGTPSPVGEQISEDLPSGEAGQEEAYPPDEIDDGLEYCEDCGVRDPAHHPSCSLYEPDESYECQGDTNGMDEPRSTEQPPDTPLLREDADEKQQREAEEHDIDNTTSSKGRKRPPPSQSASRKKAKLMERSSNRDHDDREDENEDESDIEEGTLKKSGLTTDFNNKTRTRGEGV